MKFKIDENLPTEIAEILRSAGYDALTVRIEESRIRIQADDKVTLENRQD